MEKAIYLGIQLHSATNESLLLNSSWNSPKLWSSLITVMLYILFFKCCPNNYDFKTICFS